MPTIIKFPVRGPLAQPRQPVPQAVSAPKRKKSSVLAIIIYMIVGLCWPLIQFGMTIDCLYQFIRMLYYWNTPGTYAGFRFIAHFLLYSGLFYYIAFGMPEGLRVPAGPPGTRATR